MKSRKKQQNFCNTSNFPTTVLRLSSLVFCRCLLYFYLSSLVFVFCQFLRVFCPVSSVFVFVFKFLSSVSVFLFLVRSLSFFRACLDSRSNLHQHRSSACKKYRPSGSCGGAASFSAISCLAAGANPVPSYKPT
jgi:hypothetical protein